MCTIKVSCAQPRSVWSPFNASSTRPRPLCPRRRPSSRHPERTRIPRPENFEPPAFRGSGPTRQALDEERQGSGSGSFVRQPVHALPHPEGQQARFPPCHGKFYLNLFSCWHQMMSNLALLALPRLAVPFPEARPIIDGYLCMLYVLVC